MPVIVADCPRCAAEKMTFDVTQLNFTHTEYRWQRWYEIFSVCRHCHGATIFVVAQEDISTDALFDAGLLKYSGCLNDLVTVQRYVSINDTATYAPPEYVPKEIEAVFREAATCVATRCWNAAGAMFRSCLDLATRPMLPQEDIEDLNYKTRRDLGLRLPWLFERRYLPAELRELSRCVHQDGNDGAHAGTLTQAEAVDLLEFTTELLERLYTQPEKLKLAQQRRDLRRAEEKKGQQRQ